MAALGSAVLPRSILIAGSGPNRDHTWNGYEATYLDIEPRNKPDVCASMTDMGDIGPFDAVQCCHALEHLYPHEVNRALREFKRVLKPNGVAIVIVPDLEDVRPDNKVILRPDKAPITGLHMFYGDWTEIEEFPHMAHHCGFIAETLKYALESAGFGGVQTMREENYNLVGIGINLG